MFSILVFGSTMKEVMFKDGDGSVKFKKIESVLLLEFNPYLSKSLYIISVST